MNGRSDLPGGVPKEVWITGIFSELNARDLAQIAPTCKFFKNCCDQLFPRAPWPKLPEAYTFKIKQELPDSEYKPIYLFDDKIFVQNKYRQLHYILLNEKSSDDFLRHHQKFVLTSSSPLIFLLATCDLLIMSQPATSIFIYEFKNNEYISRQILIRKRKISLEKSNPCIAASPDGKMLMNVYSYRDRRSLIEIWRLDKNNYYENVHAIKINELQPSAAVVFEDKFFILTANDKKSISIWIFDESSAIYENKQIIQLDEIIKFVYISSNQTILIQANKFYVFQINKKTLEYQCIFNFTKENVFTCIVELEKNLFALGSNAGNIHVIRMTSSDVRELAKIKRGNNAICYLAMTHDKKLLSITENMDKKSLDIAVQSFPFIHLMNDDNLKRRYKPV